MKKAMNAYTAAIPVKFIVYETYGRPKQRKNISLTIVYNSRLELKIPKQRASCKWIMYSTNQQVDNESQNIKHIRKLFVAEAVNLRNGFPKNNIQEMRQFW